MYEMYLHCFITFIHVIIHIATQIHHSLVPRLLCMGGKNREPGAHYAQIPRISGNMEIP